MTYLGRPVQQPVTATIDIDIARGQDTWYRMYPQTPLTEPRPEREVVNNDRHQPNPPRRPQGIPEGRHVSRFGHIGRHRG